MLIKEIINGISQKIYGFYEGLYDIYVEDVEQGLEVPCFMINLIFHLKFDELCCTMLSAITQSTNR